jgi:hypothetical protein
VRGACLHPFTIMTWAYFPRYEMILGRTSKTPLDVSLGDNMNVSRQHARIAYNFERKQFELTVQVCLFECILPSGCPLFQAAPRSGDSWGSCQNCVSHCLFSACRARTVSA